MVLNLGRRRLGGLVRLTVGVLFAAPALACESNLVGPEETTAQTDTQTDAQTETASKPTSPPASDVVPPEKITPPDAGALVLLETSKAGLPVVALDVAGRVYQVELAHTPAARARGMGGRRSFPAGTAMLFVHPDDLARRYWMKGCLVPIDIAFLDREGRITAMHRMPAAPPRGDRESMAAYEARLMRYPSRRAARYALEIPSGDLEALGLRVGQRLPLPHGPLQATARSATFPPGG